MAETRRRQYTDEFKSEAVQLTRKSGWLVQRTPSLHRSNFRGRVFPRDLSQIGVELTGRACRPRLTR